MLTEIYNFLFYRPIFNFLNWNFFLIKDFGFAIFLLTIILRIFLFPLNLKIQKEQKKMEIISQKLKEIQKEYKHNKEEMTKKMMEFLKNERINPLSNYLLVLIQFPIFLAIYQSLKEFSMKNLPLFLGILDLTKPNFYLAAIAGIFQYLQTSSNQSLQTIISLFVSVFLVIVFSQLPAALSLYLLFMILFNFIERLIFLKFFKNGGKIKRS
jgi:YidC/Oxa1 family membrane protein insertase